MNQHTTTQKDQLFGWDVAKLYILCSRSSCLWKDGCGYILIQHGPHRAWRVETVFCRVVLPNVVNQLYK